MNTQAAAATLENDLSTREAGLPGANHLAPGFDAHALRTGWLAARLAQMVGRSETEVQNAATAAQFHDIGKASLPAQLFEQSGALSAQQLRSIQTHPELGAGILRFGAMCSNENRRLCMHAAMFHHERWDGEGYPSGLRGHEIPEIARLVAVVDVFDALSTARPYKEAWSLARCVDYIDHRSGSHFDPSYAKAFVRLAATLPANWDQEVMLALSAGARTCMRGGPAPREHAAGQIKDPCADLAVSDWSRAGTCNPALS